MYFICTKNMLGGTLLKFLNGRLLVKFVDERFIPSTMDGNIHFSSYEYFKKMEEGANDKGKRDKNENAEFEILNPKKDLLLYRINHKGNPILGARNLKGAKPLPYKSATWRTSYPDEDRTYGISCFTVIDSIKDMIDGKIKNEFIDDISEISNNRRVLVFQERDLIISLCKFVMNSGAYNTQCMDVEYTKNNKGKRNGFQKDPRYSNQHEWRIRIDRNVLNCDNLFLPDLNIDLINNVNQIRIV